MITLNSDRGLESVEDWTEVLSLPGFTEKLNPKEHELKEIIGNYTFKDKVACGLQSCRTAHFSGYIVTTKTGHITNIGNGCGKNHFGVDFQSQSNVFKKKVEDHNNRERISQFQSRIKEHFSRLGLLREGKQGADLIYKNAKSLVAPNKNCPSVIIDEVRKIIRARDGAIIIPRIASSGEIETLEASQNRTLPRPYYIDEVKGHLKGIEALFPENDLRELLIVDISQNLTLLDGFDSDSGLYRDLSHWSKWCGEFENKIFSAEKIIKQGIALLEADNLLQLTQFIDTPDEMKRFKRWVNQNKLA